MDFMRVGRLLFGWLWWFLGLSHERLRVGLVLGNVAVVSFRYALTDRSHHVPSSPLRMALMQVFTRTSVRGSASYWEHCVGLTTHSSMTSVGSVQCPQQHVLRPHHSLHCVRCPPHN